MHRKTIWKKGSFDGQLRIYTNYSCITIILWHKIITWRKPKWEGKGLRCTSIVYNSFQSEKENDTDGSPLIHMQNTFLPMPNILKNQNQNQNQQLTTFWTKKVILLNYREKYNLTHYHFESKKKLIIILILLQFHT